MKENLPAAQKSKPALWRRIYSAQQSFWSQSAAYVVPVVVLAGASRANAAGYDIGTTDSTAFDKIVSFLQAIVDLIDGPVATAVTVISIIVAILLWAVAPKSGGMSTVVRVCIAAIVGLNVATWIVALKAGG